MPRVLIVDDHAGFRRLARALLEAEGYEVVAEAATGLDALRVAADVHPELVLLDVELPDLDGFDVARRLQTVNGSIDVILTSSRDGADYGSLVAASPVLGFVAKAELSGPALAHLLR